MTIVHRFLRPSEPLCTCFLYRTQRKDVRVPCFLGNTVWHLYCLQGILKKEMDIQEQSKSFIPYCHK